MSQSTTSWPGVSLIKGEQAKGLIPVLVETRDERVLIAQALLDLARGDCPDGTRLMALAPWGRYSLDECRGQPLKALVLAGALIATEIEESLVAQGNLPREQASTTQADHGPAPSTES